MRRILLFLFLICLIGCSEDSPKNFFNGNIRTVEFPNKVSLKGEFIDVDSIGIGCVEIFTPYLFLTTYRLPYFTKVYKLNNYEFLSDYFYQGQGPEEFLSFGIIKKQYPYLWVNDYKNKRISLINAEKTFNTELVCIEKVLNYKKVVDPFNVFYLNDTCLLIKDYNSVDRELYYLKYNPKNDSIEADWKFVIYNNPITYELMNKILTLADQIHPDGSKIVSITEKFNQIDIIDLNNPVESFSITTEKNIKNNYFHVNKTLDEELNRYYFSGPICTNDKIYVLYNTEKNDQVEVHIIDWKGNPLGILSLDKYLRYINVDEDNKILYGIDDDSEKLYKYDISECNLKID